MIEAASAFLTNCWGEASDDLQRVTPRSRENLSSCTETLAEKLRSRFEVPSEKSVWRTSTGTPMPQFSAESSEHVVEDEFRKQLEFLAPRYEPGEWK